MWAYIFRKLVYSIPVYLGVILLVMVALRVRNPVYAAISKNATKQEIAEKEHEMGLDQPLVVQYTTFLWKVVRFDFSEHSWDDKAMTVRDKIVRSIGPSVAITLPALVLTTILSTFFGMISAYFRGRVIDRTLVFFAVIGMCVSFLVYIIVGQFFGAYRLGELLGKPLFAIDGYEPGLHNWPYYCFLPVLISVIVAMGYDTRFYRAVMVEECHRDYIITAQAKGVSKARVMFVHMLKNAMIPIITRVVITLPFLISGSILLEMYFSIPGMGKTLIQAMEAKDFPVIQAFTAIFAALYILTNILTDVLYALVDPRVRLQ